MTFSAGTYVGPGEHPTLEGIHVLTATSHVQNRTMDTFRHAVVLYRGLDDLVETVLPFVREGLDLGVPVMAAMPPDRLSAIKEALGADARKVTFADMLEVGANPARIIPMWRRFVEQAGGLPARGIGEPVWSGRRDVEIDECARHESLLNLAFEGGSAWRLMCPYGVDDLPARVVDAAMRAHPERGTVAAPRVGYQGRDHAFSAFGESLPEAPPNVEVLRFGLDDLTRMRGVVRLLSREAGVDIDAAEDLVLAAHELSSNSIHHGGGVGVLRAWKEAGAFVVEVRDSGTIADPLVGRELISVLSESGRGLWMANQLCDLVQVRSAATGTVVRLHSWL